MRIVTTAFFVIAFILSLFRTNLFAAELEKKPQNLFTAGSNGLDKKLQELENLEKMQPTASKEIIARPKTEYKAADLRNPFRSPFDETVNEEASQKKTTDLKAMEEEEQPPVLTVQGIIWGGSFPQAIINDKVVKEGDVIEGVSVISIDKDGVVVSFENKKYSLPSPRGGAVSSKKPLGG